MLNGLLKNLGLNKPRKVIEAKYIIGKSGTRYSTEHFLVECGLIKQRMSMDEAIECLANGKDILKSLKVVDYEA